MNCRICSGDCSFVFREKILGRHEVSYYLCPSCGAFQTEEPYWLKEAYDSAIIDADTGIMARNVFFSEMLSCVLFGTFGSSGAYLDLAGGYGIMTRLMRDRGFEYFWSDPYCQNILSKGFEKETFGRAHFDAVSAFEVLEHTIRPLEFVKESLADSGAKILFFTTELFQEPVPSPRAWYYYAFEGGQHITFFQKRTLERMADSLGLRFYTNGVLHAFSYVKISETLLRLSRTRLRHLYLRFISGKLDSKIMKDHEFLISKSGNR
ncbi:class I SAM-dependent methyltransferase [Leptospira fluminis]|uniref:Class I SAM-dependent methyltransferase n=1 Tax=Leptospira fluminis TaxID=2484979 RepID=A0A4R9GM53_9LEPT|nr:class I SAM-dependent methyltransferase [Leptospira fluminis]